MEGSPVTAKYAATFLAVVPDNNDQCEELVKVNLRLHRFNTLLRLKPLLAESGGRFTRLLWHSAQFPPQCTKEAGKVCNRCI